MNVDNYLKATKEQPRAKTALKGKVLLVEGSSLDRAVLCESLPQQHYQVHCVEDGVTALAALALELPNVILLDTHLPDTSGYAVCQQIKANPATQHIPVVFVSASDAACDRLKAFAMGAADYIVKPFQIEEVRVRVRNQCELQQARQRIDELHNELEQRVLQRTLQLQAVHHRLKISEERLESILNTLQDVVWSASVEPFQILYLNPAATRLFQRSTDDFIRHSFLWWEVIHPEDRPEVMECMSAITSRGSVDIEHRIVLPQGLVRWVRNRSHVVVGEKDTVSVRIEGLITDISDRKRAEKQLIHDALHDGLTQLPNRTLFVDRLETAIARKHRCPDFGFAVLFLDLDRFKVVNDSIGHAAGDQLLIEVANRLLACVRMGDTVARLGGDEFTILLEEVADTAEVINCVQAIQSELSRPLVINGHNLFTSASIGIVIASVRYTTGADMLRDADIAMYRAKESRSAYELFDQEMHIQTMRRLKLENDLRASLERREFELRYQPIISLQDGMIVGFEALVRWQNPEEGLVNPDEFISIAEETGLIVPLGDWILEEACCRLKQWQQIAPQFNQLTMNVNVASQQLRDLKLLQTLDRILQEINLLGPCLRLEMTESTLIEHTDAAIDVLQQIRQRHVQISIDDFGTGYSSLSYLSRLPINNLKIDKSFVGQIHLQADSLEIVRTIATLAKTLGMNVTAEGIELDLQLDLLRAMDCEYGQGYYFSKPLNADQVRSLLIEQIS